MTPRITTTGRDSFTPPVAMAPARRMHIHGPVQSSDEAEDRGWTWLAGYALVLIGGVIGVGLYGWTW